MIIFSILVLLSGYIRLAQTNNYQFPLTFDQSRDLLEMRPAGTFRDIPVIGPTTSINGLFLGPGYYYFNLPAFWIGGGDPQVLMWWNILWFLIAGVAVFCFFYKRDKYLGLLIATIYLFAPQLFDTTRYFWNAHAMVYIMVFYFLTWWWFIEKPTIRRGLALGIIAGMSMHFEAAMGIVAVGFAVLTVLTFKSWKLLGWFFLGLIPCFLPQIAVELFKGFRMTKLFFGSGAEMLGEKLSLGQTFSSHLTTFQKYFEGQFILNAGIGKYLLLLIIPGLFAKKYRKYLIGLLGFGLFAFGFYLFGYKHELKIWYAESLRVWYIFIVSIGIFSLIKNKLVGLIVILFLARNIFLTYNDQKQFINNPNFAKDDPKLAEHEIKAVDWVYQEMKGEGFKAYNYVPEIYDYPYQYIYWWYGVKKYGYMPGEVAYEPRVPQYIPKQYDFYKKSKDSEDTIALIYEKKSDYLNWRDKFNDYCVKSKIDFGWNVGAEIVVKCK